jgi:hypothetical protein
VVDALELVFDGVMEIAELTFDGAGENVDVLLQLMEKRDGLRALARLSFRHTFQL